MKDISIIEQRGSHLLIERGGRFAVIERRGDLVYGVGGGSRDGQPDTPAGIAAALGSDGWGDEAGTRATFREIASRGEELARDIW